MKLPGSGRVLLAAVGAAAAGLSLAVLVARTGLEMGREVGAYALGILPLAAFVGGLAGRRSQDPPTAPVSAGIGGALIAVAAAFVMASVQATVRFRYLGSSGFVLLTTLPYTRESLMQVGLLPGILALGAAVARRPRAGVARALLGSALVGAVGSLLVGPTLVLTAVLGRLPLLNPLVVALVTTVIVAAVPRRS